MAYAPYDPSSLWRFLVRLHPDGSPVLSTDKLSYRVHDWPISPNDPLGNETCDCVLGADGFAQFQLELFQPWDRFVDAGDGGDVGVIHDGSLKFLGTEDGGYPGQFYYFVGPGIGQPADGRIGGWLAAGPDVQVARWTNQTCWLQTSFNTPYAAPPGLSPSWTRYLIDTFAVPFLVAGGSPSWPLLEVLVSEHYDGTNPYAATAVERFWFAAGHGKVRWESWALPGLHTPDPTVNTAPPIAYGGVFNPPLASQLQMIDVRHYANIVPAAPLPVCGPPQRRLERRLRVSDTGWPPALVLP